MAKKLCNITVVPVVDQNGHQFDKRELHNTALAELYPKMPVVVIDWVRADGKRPTLELIQAPVPFDGQMYLGNLGWGSGIKRGETIGFPEGCDPLVESGLLKTAERTIKTGRMLLSEGLYGGCKGSLNVLIVRRGTVVNGNPVDDGHSLVGESFASSFYSDQPAIRLDGGRLNYSIFQRIPWDAVKEELVPAIQDFLLDMTSADWSYRDDVRGRPEISKERREIAALDSAMGEHPYIATQYARASAEFFARLATTAPIPVRVKVAVPTTAPQSTTVGANVLVRYPCQANGSLQAVRNNASREEKARIAAMEVIQYTIATHDLMANGCLGVIPDDQMPEGIDVVLCQDDIKMGSKRLGKRVQPCCLLFNQRFAAGCAVGINGSWAKNTLNADFDGDLIFVLDCKEFPRVWQAVKNLPPGANAKIAKTKSPVYERDRMLLNGMANLVGFATNVMSATFLIADRVKVAEMLGFKTVESMDKQLGYLVSLGTDGFKTMIDLVRVEKQIGNLQNKLKQVTTRMAPWSRWPNGWAFSRGAPGYWHKGLPKHEDRNSILKWWDGTIAEICRITLPYLKNVIGQPVKMCPLSTYRAWAPMVDESILKAMKVLQNGFQAKLVQTNLTSSSQWLSLRSEWQAELRQWCKKNMVSQSTAAFALWRVAHSSRSDESSGASVFMGFPEEVRSIITDKPGKKIDEALMLVGLHYVLDDKFSKHLVVPVEVREFVQLHRGKKIVRRILCVHSIKGKKDGRAPYPKDILGTVEIHSPQPDIGSYQAIIDRSGKGQAWHCRLTAN